MSSWVELAVEQLHTPCDPATLPFVRSDELAEAGEEVLHERAAEAMRFGLDIRRPGYNLFVLGDAGSDRHAFVRRLIEQHGANGRPACDWCYVNNFADATRPRLLSLPAGRGARLRDDMQRFVGELAPAITSAFESDEYRLRAEAVQRDEKEREEQALRALGHETLPHGIALVRTEQGFTFVPMKGEEEALSSEEYAQLPPERQAELVKATEHFQEKLRQLFLQFPRWRREAQNAMRAAGREALQSAVGHLIEELQARYADLPEVQAHLAAVEKDVVDTGAELRESRKSEGEVETMLYTGTISVQRYLVNLLVAHDADGHPPVVCEDHPTFQNLVGRVEHVAHMGMLVSNFTLIQAGALHRANGGYLVLDAARVLAQPFAWEGLKRVLKSGKIRIESLGEMYGFAGTQQLLPQPVPLDLKVVLVGERMVYYLLSELDPEFPELFKVAADCASEVERQPANVLLYARLLAARARSAGLKPLSAAAVARVIEHAARLAEDAERLSARTRTLVDILSEADHLAGSGELIDADHVEAALRARERRADRLRDEHRRAILRETLLVATDGTHVGQINGLAAVNLGEFVFAHPVRITASAYLGDGELIDIEREVEMGGPIHSKGMMILAAFFSGRYGRVIPLAFSASLVFEQSYGDVEGDSASLAELCALLSTLGSLPIRQSLAITGSVNQFGVAQAIGAVNEKIEGFFDICRARGLTGEQGVIIPAANVKHLMLSAEVRAAVAAGQFHVYAVKHVDEAIELLTGVAAGEPDAKGEVPAGTVNFAVATQLMQFAVEKHEFAERAAKLAKPARGGKTAKPARKKATGSMR